MKLRAQKRVLYSLGFLAIICISLVQSYNSVAIYSMVKAEVVPQDQFRSTSHWVKYRIEYSFNYTTRTSNNILKAWLFRINNITTEVDPNYANMQISHLKRMEIKGADNSSFCESDAHGNSIFYYEREFKNGQPNWTFSAYYEYEVTLYQTEWNYTSQAIGNITPSLPQYIYTQAVPYIESNNSALITRSNNITAGITDTQLKIKAIFDFVKNYLNYTLRPRAYGALDAYLSGYGDCSEYASLTVALLRAQGIPARKALGLVVIDPESRQNVPLYQPKKMQSFSYETLPGHAWIQYFLPNVGWVTADPTWASGSGYQTSGYGNFFDEQDYVHLTLSVGDYFGAGITPPLFNDPLAPWAYQELGVGPFFAHSSSDFDYSVDYRFTILDFDVPAENPLNLTTMILFGSMVALVIGLIAYAFKPRKKTVYVY